jgi:hypothetical protein
MPSRAGAPVVSYSVRFEGAALVQLNGLPAAAFDALVERVVDLVDEPWDASVMPPGSIADSGSQRGQSVSHAKRRQATSTAGRSLLAKTANTFEK